MGETIFKQLNAFGDVRRDRGVTSEHFGFVSHQKTLTRLRNLRTSSCGNTRAGVNAGGGRNWRAS